MKKRAKKVGIIVAIMLGVGVLGGVIMMKLHIYLPCSFRRVTGLLCPGCGATRMMIAIMRLDFKEAFSYNSMLFVFLPLILFIIGSMCYNYIKRGNLKVGRKTEILAIVLIVVFLLFAIIRNIL